MEFIMSDEIKSVIDNLNSTFEDFKSENAKRLDEIEKKGSADPLLVEKVDKMADDISKTVSSVVIDRRALQVVVPAGYGSNTHTNLL